MDAAGLPGQGGICHRLALFLFAVLFLRLESPGQALPAALCLELDQFLSFGEEPLQRGFREPSPGNACAHGHDFALPEAASRPVEAAGSAGYRDLIRREGEEAIVHGRAFAGMALRWSPIAGLVNHLSLSHHRPEAALGQAGLRLEDGSAETRVRNALSLAVAPGIMATADIAYASPEPAAAFRAAGLEGRHGHGLIWSLEIGREGGFHPLTLHLEGYRPIEMPLMLRRRFQAAALGWQGSRLSLGWQGRFIQARHPAIASSVYALADSGFMQDHSLLLEWRQPGAFQTRHRLRLRGLAGEHFFRAYDRNRGPAASFAFQHVDQAAMSGSWDLRLKRGRWRIRGTLSASALELQARRPEKAYGRYFWDRNRVMETYQGEILGLFNRETWLMDGRLLLTRFSARPDLELDGHNLRLGLGLGYHYITAEAGYRLTRKTTEFLLAYREEERSREYPEQRIHLLRPAVRVEIPAAAWALELRAAQSVPVHYRQVGGTGGSGGAAGEDAPSGGWEWVLTWTFGFGSGERVR